MNRVIIKGDSLLDQQTLDVKTCPVCGIRYAVPAEFMKIKDRDAGDWYCPNGHNLIFTKPEAKRLQEDLTRTKSQLDQARSDARWQADKRAAVERTNAALKGHLTRYRKRIANGVCPVQGCKRHFLNVQRHVADEHSDWLAEHSDVFDPANG